MIPCGTDHSLQYLKRAAAVAAGRPCSGSRSGLGLASSQRKSPFEGWRGWLGRWTFAGALLFKGADLSRKRDITFLAAHRAVWQGAVWGEATRKADTIVAILPRKGLKAGAFTIIEDARGMIPPVRRESFFDPASQNHLPPMAWPGFRAGLLGLCGARSSAAGGQRRAGRD